MLTPNFRVTSNFLVPPYRARKVLLSSHIGWINMENNETSF